MDDVTKAAALRAYERGRFFVALKKSWVVIPLGMSGVLLDVPVLQLSLLTVALFALAVFGGWRRTEWGAGMVAGAWAAIGPVVLGISMRLFPEGMTEAQCYAFCLSGSLLMGAALGAWLARRAARPELGRHFFIASLISALIAISSGCLAIGFGSIFGLAAGVLVVGLPAYVRFSSANASAG